MKIVFWPTAWEDYLYWQGEDAKELARLNLLLKDACAIPFAGRVSPSL